MGRDVSTSFIPQTFGSLWMPFSRQEREKQKERSNLARLQGSCRGSTDNRRTLPPRPHSSHAMPKCRRCPDPSLLALLMLAASVPVVSFQPCRVARVAGLGPGRGETRRTALSCDAGQRQSPQAPAGGVVPPEIAELRGAVAAVKKMKSVRYDTLNHTCRPGKPTYRRLFTHQTWNEHLGGSTFSRWIKCVKGVPYSVIVRATWKSVVFMMAYTLVVSQVG